MPHTPAPWSATDTVWIEAPGYHNAGGQLYQHVENGDGVVALVPIDPDEQGTAPDVLVVTAAPELLAALRSADQAFAQIHKFNRLPAGENNAGWRDVRAAIAKAEGRS
jgi:hypothetical protein